MSSAIPDKSTPAGRGAECLFDSGQGAKKVLLQDKLGDGAEGVVFRTGAVGQCAKVYYSKILASERGKLFAKISHMTRNPPTSKKDGSFHMAWPQGPIFQGGSGTPGHSTFVGFAMPLLSRKGSMDAEEPDSLQLHLGKESASGSGFSRPARMIIALHLAEALEAIHKSGYVVGDINPQNLRLSDAGELYVVDCDSFEFTAGGVTFSSAAYSPKYQSPEFHTALEGKKAYKRSVDDDLFGFAVIVFQLLMSGSLPYRARESRKSDVQEITSRTFAFTETSLLKPPKHAPASRFKEFTPELREHFEQTFTKGRRPSASSWRSVLLKQILSDPEIIAKAAKLKSKPSSSPPSPNSSRPMPPRPPLGVVNPTSNPQAPSKLAPRIPPRLPKQSGVRLPQHPTPNPPTTPKTRVEAAATLALAAALAFGQAAYKWLSRQPPERRWALYALTVVLLWWLLR